MDRQSAVHQLYILSYPHLSVIAYETYAGLLVWDADHILQRLADALPSYTGELETEPFELWSGSFVRHEAERFRLTETILREHRRVIFSAIRKALQCTAQDCSVGPEDVFSEIAAYLFQNAHAFAKPGTAKLSTRLVGLVRRHVQGYHVRNRNNRLRLVQDRIDHGEDIYCEVLSTEELASDRADAIAA